MQKINDASLKWSNEESDKKLSKLKDEFNQAETQIKSDYDLKIVDLNNQIDNFKKEAEVI